MASIVKIANLDKYFGRLHVLKNISLEVQAREVVCLIGRSGSGKSTLLRCINFLEEPSDGSIEVDGISVHSHGRGKEHRQLVHDVRLKTGMQESVGIAVGLFIAAVHQMGLVTLTHTPNPMGFLAEVLDRPPNEKAFLILPVGYPAPGAMVPDLQRKALEDIAVFR